MMNFMFSDAWIIKIDFTAHARFDADFIDFGTFTFMFDEIDNFLSNEDMIDEILNKIFTEYGAKFAFEYSSFKKVEWYLYDSTIPNPKKHDITNDMNDFFYFDYCARYGR